MEGFWGVSRDVKVHSKQVSVVHISEALMEGYSKGYPSGYPSATRETVKYYSRSKKTLKIYDIKDDSCTKVDLSIS